MPERSLYISSLNLELVYFNLIPLYCAYILLETIKECFSIETKIKWPNDLYYNNHKLAGILVESENSGSITKNFNIGIGLMDKLR